MKIAIVGAGAMGCLFGAYLSKQNRVTLTDVFEDQVKAINEKGITVLEQDGETHYTANLQAIRSGAPASVQDLVIIFVKNTQTDDAMQSVLSMIGENTLLLTLQNGAGNDRIISKYLPDRQIVVGTTKHNSVNLGNATVRHGVVGDTTVGSLVGNREAAQAIADIFNECGIRTAIDDDINRIIWAKLFVNLASNATTALLNTSLSFMKEGPAWEVAKMLIHEAIAVAAADGYAFDEETVQSTIMETLTNAKGGITSMCQDRRKKLKTEIDRINGAVSEKGKKYSIPTPCNDMIVLLIHAMEETYE